MHHSTLTTMLAFTSTTLANLLPRETDEPNCISVSVSIVSLVTNAPGYVSATDAAVYSYMSPMSTRTQSDACAVVTNAPSSISSGLSAWISSIDAYYTSNAEEFKSLSRVFESACASAQFKDVPDFLGEPAAFSTAMACETNAKAVVGTTSTTNAAPACTGMGAAGAVVAVVLGAVVAL